MNIRKRMQNGGKIFDESTTAHKILGVPNKEIGINLQNIIMKWSKGNINQGGTITL